MTTAAKTIGRRLFARAAIGVPTVLKMGVGAPHLPPMGGGLGVANAAMAGMQMSAGDIAKQSFVSKIWDSVRRGTQTERDYENLRYSRRHMMGGLDPDLAVLNSMSLQRRVQIQIDREKQAREVERSVRHRIIKGLGGNPEEFE